RKPGDAAIAFTSMTRLPNLGSIVHILATLALPIATSAQHQDAGGQFRRPILRGHQHFRNARRISVRTPADGLQASARRWQVAARKYFSPLLLAHNSRMWRSMRSWRGDTGNNCARSERDLVVLPDVPRSLALQVRESDLETADHVSGRIPILGFI